MSDRENFISAILAEPNDDVNRLAFADWLDDNGEGERDRATAEFIRLSCRMEQSNRLSHAEGKWLDGGLGDHENPRGYAKLLPTLFAWIEKMNAKFREEFGFKDRIPLNEMKPSIRWERKGRNLILKYTRSPLYIPEICTIEFWRGFVRKVVNRHYETSDEFIRLILPDQPLCEPTLRWMKNRDTQPWATVWSVVIGKRAHELMPEVPAKVRPDH